MTTLNRYREIRARSLMLTEPLTAEDQVVQSMPDASPTKWHLAHTTWFFETFVFPKIGLSPVSPPLYREVFNSYYEGVGPQFSRAHRGTLSRPGVEEVRGYRTKVDACIERALEEGIAPELERLVELGLHHEEQHQELLITDIKHALCMNPLAPIYRASPVPKTSVHPRAPFRFDEGMHAIGLPIDHSGFCFDNETPEHQTFVPAFELSSKLVTNAEWLAFMRDGGYSKANLWLSDGWAWVNANSVKAPLYWHRGKSGYEVRTLHGVIAPEEDAPVTHISFFEADAFARWAGKRLPTEFEWEVAARANPQRELAQLLDSMPGYLHPRETGSIFGTGWQWTSSAYLPYPKYTPLPGSLGEYNGKFMNAQRVLRGGSLATPRDHVRPTYRNFFQPEKRWQFTALRLAN